ncbi:MULTISPECIES: ABC transporter ATP-binding protein [unclassified Corallococcus]|uniref:ABC transporter ATP-binding protein n=1 Tax=unclassified Corallococcus TaxID=2685029 RepID=UPI001A8E2CE1|nr:MULTISPECIES: ABC transporter ATP-binding protein [unclassified Corallococcus]MBN9686231.1 ABC transporter ATP-binding protein [Corallococcus sp. NCSPR001]WAS82337.1 ABC transporter ATP-binding protein [Corallococcus sp. NCRR]
MTAVSRTEKSEEVSDQQGRLAALRNILPVLRIVWEAGPRTVVAHGVLRSLAALCPLAVLLVARWIVDGVVATAGTGQGMTPRLWGLVALEFGLAILGAVLNRGIEHMNVVLREQYTRHISLRLMDQASRLDLSTYEDPGFHDRLERARAQATDRLMMVAAIARFLQLGLTTVSLCAGIVLYSPWLLLNIAVCLVPAALGEAWFGARGYAMNFRHTPRRRELDYLRQLGASRENAKELKIFGLSPFLMHRYDAVSKELMRDVVGLSGRALFGLSLLSVVSSFGYYGAYAFVIHQAASGVLSVGELTFLAGAIAGANRTLQELSITGAGIADQSLYLRDMLSFFALKPSIHSRPDALPVPRPIRKGLEFRDVTFIYPGRPEPILQGVNFHIAPGERIALIGENGQGKTTLVKLLMRLYEPTSGQILLDGVDLKDYRLEDLWNEVGVIFQDFARYEMSARQNIAVGRIEQHEDDERIVDAARKSQADTVIDKLPARYAQMLGRRFDGGLELSGGEWQRIALARAYLRDAQILVLDEPTAALDARAELDVFNRFGELSSGKMALLISHRFSTVKMADRIFVLANGKIVEEGHHEHLMAAGGRYATMYELQASRYR